MKLIGGSQSPFVRRIAMVLEALGLGYDQEVVRTDQDGERIRRYNPVGRVPVLVLDDERVIIDSHAILDYLERRGPATPLFPQEEALRMRVLFADSVALAGMEKLVLWFYEKHRRDPALRCAATVGGYETQMLEALRWLGANCSPGAYLCGDELTLADITTTSLLNTMTAVAADLVQGLESAEARALASRVTPQLAAAR
ncbi:MAG: glutathione S-transferase family protein [Pseudomonadota bacterium]